MPKRRRLLTPKSKSKQTTPKRASLEVEENEEKEVSTARGRLKGALMEVLEPAEESDASYEPTPTKRERYHDHKSEAEEYESPRKRHRSPVRQSYVLKLFDRSVDLSQFEENSPLYPICRAWMINQPKANYQDFGQVYEEPDRTEDSIVLPGPEGPPVSRIPELLPEQKERNKDNINLNYREAPPPSMDQLIRWHSARWASVRQAWVDQAHRVEARYADTQTVLNKISISAL